MIYNRYDIDLLLENIRYITFTLMKSICDIVERSRDGWLRMSRNTHTSHSVDGNKLNSQS